MNNEIDVRDHAAFMDWLRTEAREDAILHACLSFQQNSGVDDATMMRATILTLQRSHKATMDRLLELATYWPPGHKLPQGKST